MAKLHIKKGDNVIVLAGEDKGKTGKVLKMLIDKQRAIVEGIAFALREGLESIEKSQKQKVKGTYPHLKPEPHRPQNPETYPYRHQGQ